MERFGGQPVDLLTLLWTGAYPRIYDRQLDPARWLADYTATYVERDVRQVLRVGDLETFAAFLKLVAARTGNELHLTKLGGDAGVTHPTARAWVSVLETSFLCMRLPAWRRNPRKQAVKTAKIHMIDTGLACYLLGITEPGQLRHHPLRGALFESWVVSEVLKSRLHRGLPERMFHVRDAKGLEVDLLVEEGDRLTAVEVKPASTVASDFFASLSRLGSRLADRQPHLTFDPRIVYAGDTDQQRREAMVVAWRRLHEHRW